MCKPTRKLTSTAAAKPEPLPKRIRKPRKASRGLAERIGASVCDETETDGQKVVITWTNDEDQTIHDLVAKMGFKWHLISEEMSGRSANAIRNRWHRLQKAQELRKRAGVDSDDEHEEHGKSSYRCRKCGLPKKGHTCPYIDGPGAVSSASDHTSTAGSRHDSSDSEADGGAEDDEVLADAAPAEPFMVPAAMSVPQPPMLSRGFNNLSFSDLLPRQPSFGPNDLMLPLKQEVSLEKLSVMPPPLGRAQSSGFLKWNLDEIVDLCDLSAEDLGSLTASVPIKAELAEPPSLTLTPSLISAFCVGG